MNVLCACSCEQLSNLHCGTTMCMCMSIFECLCVCVRLKFKCPLLYFLHFQTSSAYSTNQEEVSHISLNEPIKLALQKERPQGTNALPLLCSSSLAFPLPLTAIPTLSSSHLWLPCYLSSFLSSCLSQFFILLFPGLSLFTCLNTCFSSFLCKLCPLSILTLTRLMDFLVIYLPKELSHKLGEKNHTDHTKCSFI